MAAISFALATPQLVLLVPTAVYFATCHPLFAFALAFALAARSSALLLFSAAKPFAITDL